MDTVRSGIGDVGEETRRQFALDVKVPLLYISPLRIAMSADPKIRSQAGVAIRRYETRNVGSSQTGEVAPRRSDDSGVPEWTGLSTAERVRPSYRKHRS